MASNERNPAGEDAVTLPVHQEDLHIGKRRVDTGRGVRVHKTVAEHPHPIDQTLLHDEVQVRHVAVDKIVALADAPAARYEGDTYIVPILEEVLVVEKRVRIKEEVHITRLRRARRHVDSVLLKSESVAVERFDEGPGTPRK